MSNHQRLLQELVQATFRTGVSVKWRIWSQKSIPVGFIISYNALLLQRTGSIFHAFIQRTDSCKDVPWLLVQTRHSLCCSHKRYANCHSIQHMLFCQNHQSLRCQHMISWYLSHCTMTAWLMLAWANVQTHQSSLSTVVNSSQIAEIACAGSNCDLRTIYVRSEGFGESAQAIAAHLCNIRCVVCMSQKCSQCVAIKFPNKTFATRAVQI